MSSVSVASQPFQSFAELHERVGYVPLDRIMMDPPPSTATVDDVIRHCDGANKRLCELIDGVLVEKTTGLEESRLAVRLSYLLLAWLADNDIGIVSGSDGPYRLPDSRVRFPDVAFLAYEKLPENADMREKVPAWVPTLAVEVLSENNSAAEMTEKLHNYFDAGVELVWYADPRTRCVEVLRIARYMRDSGPTAMSWTAASVSAGISNGDRRLGSIPPDAFAQAIDRSVRQEPLTMSETPDHLIEYLSRPELDGGTMILSFSGWMDGGDASTGTVKRLVRLLDARQFASIDAEPFYILNFPGSMEIAAMFRPMIDIEDGLVRSIDMPRNRFFVAPDHKLILFRGNEPNMKWRTFGECIFKLAHDSGVKRLIFVGSFGGAVPHTREPRMYVTCSEERLHEDLENVGLRRTGYEGPGSFMTYLTTQAPSAGLEMVSLVAEIPGYLQGTNPFCIEAITRRLARILQLSLDLDELRAASNDWEVEVSTVVEENDDMLEKIRELEDEYDNDLLEQDDVVS